MRRAVVVLALVAGVLVSGQADGQMTTASTSPGNVCAVDPADGEAAITAAIAGCPDGSTVRFPSNRQYNQMSEIVVRGRADLVIDGNGSRFVSRAPNSDQLDPNWMIVEGRNIVVTNMTVEGNFKMGAPRSLERMQQEFPAGNHFNMGIGIYGGDGVTVRDLTVLDTFGDGIMVAPSGIMPGGRGPGYGSPTNVTVERVSITRTARQGFAVTGASHVRLRNSTIRDCWYLCVDLETDVPGQDMTDIHVTGNTFEGMFFAAVALPWPGDGTDVRRIYVNDNKAPTPPDSCGPQIAMNHYPYQVIPVHEVYVERNHLVTWSKGVLGRSIVSGAVRDNGVEKREPRACGEDDEAPVVLHNSPNVAVSGNTGRGYCDGRQGLGLLGVANVLTPSPSCAS